MSGLFSAEVLLEAQQVTYEKYIAQFEAHKVQLITEFVDELGLYEGVNVYNPWSDVDLNYDNSLEASRWRRQNFITYALPRLGRANTFVVAEAVGYQGGRYSGIAITCERMLLGLHSTVDANQLAEIPLWRTSSQMSEHIKSIQREKGFNEPTDTVVWNAIIENGINPYDIFLWNIFPFHPYKSGEPMTNRTPTDEEQQLGWEYTKKLLDLNALLGGGDRPLILAVGQKSADTMGKFGIIPLALRHPANGGANKYREGFKEAMNIRQNLLLEQHGLGEIIN